MLSFYAVFSGYLEKPVFKRGRTDCAWALLINLLIMFIFIFFLRPFAALMQKVLPGEDETLPIWPEFLDRKYLSNSGKALDNVQKELQREINLTRKMF